MNYTIVDESIPLIVDQMIVEIQREHLSQDTYFTGITRQHHAHEMNAVGVNTLVSLWDAYLQQKITIPNLLKGGVDIDYFTYADNPNQITYFVGGESMQDNKTSFHQITMKKGDYYVCRFEGENFDYLVSDALYKANAYFFDVWLKHKGITMEHLEPFLLQKYFTYEDAPRIEIWVQKKQ